MTKFRISEFSLNENDLHLFLSHKRKKKAAEKHGSFFFATK